MIFNEGHAVAEGELPSRHQLTAHCLLGQADVLHIKKDYKGGCMTKSGQVQVLMGDSTAFGTYGDHQGVQGGGH